MRKWNRTDVVYFKKLFQHFRVRTEKNHKIPNKFINSVVWESNPVGSHTRSRSTKHLATASGLKERESTRVC
jgi:hypothetical protein